mmetsp:Transcript_41024/g.65032  ORF Transcript_41024/g.65032 Transcript_41024/m.65032 type:complete len:120 (+) Transcript_41024:45-404(+)
MTAQLRKTGDSSTFLTPDRSSANKDSLDEVIKLMGEMSTDIQAVDDMLEDKKNGGNANEKQDDEPWEVKPQSSNRSNSSVSGMIKAGFKGVASAAQGVRRTSKGSQASDQSESFMDNRE